jgi:hypothetical protein
MPTKYTKWMVNIASIPATKTPIITCTNHPPEKAIPKVLTKQ